MGFYSRSCITNFAIAIFLDPPFTEEISLDRPPYCLSMHLLWHTPGFTFGSHYPGDILARNDSLDPIRDRLWMADKSGGSLFFAISPEVTGLISVNPAFKLLHPDLPTVHFTDWRSIVTEIAVVILFHDHIQCLAFLLRICDKLHFPKHNTLRYFMPPMSRQTCSCWYRTSTWSVRKVWYIHPDWFSGYQFFFHVVRVQKNDIVGKCRNSSNNIGFPSVSAMAT